MQEIHPNSTGGANAPKLESSFQTLKILLDWLTLEETLCEANVNLKKLIFKGYPKVYNIEHFMTYS